jgi:hypothetical protein
MHHALFTSFEFAVVQDGTSMTGIAERSRRTGMAFVNGVGAGWGPSDLAQWLRGPYRRAIRVPEELDLPEVPLGPGPHEELMQEVTRARESVVGLVRHLMTLPGRVPFVESAITSGLLVPCESEHETGWIATWQRGASLRHLVAALFAADYLIRPIEYRDQLSICPMCEALLFDMSSRMRGNCGMHGDSTPLSLARPTPVIPITRKADTRKIDRRAQTIIGLGTQLR